MDARERVLYFYDEQWRRRGFGADGTHKGLDIATDGGEPIYALREGFVVSVQVDDQLGGYVIIQYGDSAFDGYCHVVPSVAHGYYASMGDVIGHAAGWSDGDYRGSAWTGPHLHKTEGSSVYPWVGVRDPAPGIDAVLAALRNPPAPKLPNQRTTASWPVGFRAQADLDAANIAKLLDPGTVIDCIWWQYGEGAAGENRFLLAKHGGLEGYVHIGDVLESGTDGIPEYEGQKRPPFVEDDPIFKPIPSTPDIDTPVPGDAPYEPHQPTIPPQPTTPEEDTVKPVETPRPALDQDALEQLLAAAKTAPTPEQPVIPDQVAKPLWIVLALIAVSVGPIVALTLIDYAAWGAAAGNQFAATVGSWAGAVAAVLGVSRFAKTRA